MRSSFFHIGNTRPKLSLVFAILLSAFCGAQEVMPPPEADTLLETARDTTIPFRKVSVNDTYIEHRFIADSTLNRIKSDEEFWYADAVPEKKREIRNAEKSPFYFQAWFRSLLWLLIVGAFIAIIIWFLMVSDIRLFRKPSPVIQAVSEETVSEDIFSIDYEQQIQKVRAEKDFRQAIRFMYWHILKLLAKKSVIRYKTEHTNSDYLMQMLNTPYYTDFFRLTRNFEYTWYGKFTVTEAVFETIQKDYHHFKSRLQS